MVNEYGLPVVAFAGVTTFQTLATAWAVEVTLVL